MKRFFIFITIMMGLVVLCVGCSKIEEEESGPKIYTYQLGENEITEYGDSFSFQTKGIMGIPEGEELPILLILHGAYHGYDKSEDEYDPKFTSLVRSFAEKGYVSIAIDISDAYNDVDLKQQMYYVKGILVSHFKALVSADMGRKIFDVDLRNKLDFKKLSVLGHERGAEAALYFADDLVRQNIYIKSLVMIDASSDYPAEDIYYDVPTVAIVSNKDNIPPNVEALYELSKSDVQRKNPFYILSLNQNGANCLSDENLKLVIDGTDSFVKSFLFPVEGTDERIDQEILEREGIEILKE